MLNNAAILEHRLRRVWDELPQDYIRRAIGTDAGHGILDRMLSCVNYEGEQIAAWKS